MKMVRNLLLSTMFGALLGFVGVTVMLGDIPEQMLVNINIIIIALYVIIFLMWGWSFYLYRSIIRLDKMNVNGEEEDEQEEIIYRKFSDYSLFISSSSFISILALSLAVITTLDTALVIIGIIVSIGSYGGTIFMSRLMQIVYSDRPMPDIADSKFAEKLIDMADEGERHVIMHGLYKAHNLLNVVLVVAIVAATIYLISTETPQTFSIVLMTLALLVVNGRYSLYIRNK